MIAGEQDPLALLGREAMGNKAGAALAPVNAITVPITKKALTRPAPAVWASLISSIALRR